MTAEVKLRTLAASDATLQGIFGYPLFRWNMLGQLEQGYIQRGTCARVRRISTQSNYVMTGPVAFEVIRFQFDFLDFDRAAAFAAADNVCAWFQTISLMSQNQFLSPVQPAPCAPNFQVNRRTSIETGPEKQVYVVTDDWMVENSPSF